MATKPNILFIFTDQHRRDVAGFAGDQLARTEHLDALAARSVQFDSAVTPSPICTPARMCVMTGKDAHRCAAWSNHWIIFPEHITWPAHFSSHGYRTCLVGKMHFGGRDQLQGFQCRPYGDFRHGLGHQPDPIHLFPGYQGAGSGGISEIPESLLQDVVVTRETLAWLLEHSDREPDVPWFVCASYSRPHPPFTAPGRYIRRYRDKVPPPSVPSHDPQELEAYARQRYESFTEIDAETIQRGREGYYACVDFVDDCIGELLAGLEEAGSLDNTIVIYTSDHGEMLGEHGMWGKSIYYEESIMIPMLMTGPGIAAGHHRVAAPISLLDLYPTTAALAGLPVPEDLDGVDMSAILADPAGTATPRSCAPSAYYTYGVVVHGRKGPDDAPNQAFRLVRDDRWKYIEVERGAQLLFDLDSDPRETANLAAEPEHKERCDRMAAELARSFDWDEVHLQLVEDRARREEQMSGQKPSTPNQYMLPDGRIFDAEAALYEARWLHIPPDMDGGIIPQQWG